MKTRTVQPELLDELPRGDPRAIRSRRDLQRVNAWMGNARLIAHGLSEAARPTAPRRIVDLGAGDGSFLLQWVRHMPFCSTGIEVVLVDRIDAVDLHVVADLRARGLIPRSVQADAADWLRARPAETGTWVVANLFLHHFPAESLRLLLRLIADKTDLCCACEPRRGWGPLAASRLLGLIGANVVTRRDAVLSVRAGFQAGELSALWPAGGSWHCREQRAGLFSHLFVAHRR